MIEYTSLEVSKRLAEGGFDAQGDLSWNMCGDERTDKPVLTTYSRWKDSVIYPAYRADTLLAWLMNEPPFSSRTHTVSVKAEGVRMVGKKDYELRLFVTATLGSGKTIEADAPTLPDALAEVVMQVMKMMGARL